MTEYSSSRRHRVGSDYSSQPTLMKEERIVLSRKALFSRTNVSERTKQLVGEKKMEKIVKECKQLYHSSLPLFVPHSPSTKRVKLSNALIPFLDKVNASFRRSKVPVYMTLESEYQSVFASSPIYYISIKQVPVLPFHEDDASTTSESSEFDQISDYLPGSSLLLRHRRHSM